jgi:hypothetical protein
MSSITSGELITKITDGTNLVDGKQTWEYAETKKHDLEFMKRCCDAELLAMQKSGFVAAPYYFERVAILSRQIKNYAQEVAYCELYINAVESFYEKNGSAESADVRKGARYKAILKRLPKAKELNNSKIT